MSVYDYEIVKLNGEYKCYVRIQNDWTGQIGTGSEIYSWMAIHIIARLTDRD